MKRKNALSADFSSQSRESLGSLQSLLLDWSARWRLLPLLMLRILLILLTCSNAVAIMPSSKPAMQPVLLSTDAEALADPAAQPFTSCAARRSSWSIYPPDAPPAYLRAVHVLIVAGICWLHIAYMRLPLVHVWLGQPITSCLKDLTTRCSLHFCKMHSFNCEFACLQFGTTFSGTLIMSAMLVTIIATVYADRLFSV